jgi:hypothetical protein
MAYTLMPTGRVMTLFRSIEFTSTTIDELLANEFGREYRYQVYGRSIHHYTDLNAARLLIDSGNVWLSDARYCNDRREIEHARAIIKSEFDDIGRTQTVRPPAAPLVSLQGIEPNSLEADPKIG